MTFVVHLKEIADISLNEKLYRRLYVINVLGVAKWMMITTKEYSKEL